MADFIIMRIILYYLSFHKSALEILSLIHESSFITLSFPLSHKLSAEQLKPTFVLMSSSLAQAKAYR